MKVEKTFPACLVLIPLYSLSALADDTEVITVTAHKYQKAELESPYNVSVVSQKDLYENNIRSMADSFKLVPGVLVQKTAYGQGSPFIRGFTGFRNLFLIDGIKLNNSVFREGPNQYWNTVDPFSMKRMEVVKGPLSAIYGSDAIGGTVNVVTAIQSMDDIKSSHTFAAFLRGASAEDSAIFNVNVNHDFSSDTGISLSGNIKSFDDIKAGDNTELPYTGYDEYNMNMKLLHQLDNHWLLSVAYLKTKQDDVPRTHKTINAVPFAGSTVGSEITRDHMQERTLTYIKLSSTDVTAMYDEMELTASLHQQDEFRERLRTRDRFDTSGFNVDTTGLQANFLKQVESNQIVYGFEYYRDKVDSFSSKSTIQGPIADDASYDWLGVYLQVESELSENWQSSVGVRFSDMEVDANSVLNPNSGLQETLNDSWDNISTNFRLSYQPNATTHWYVGVAQGFRAPNLSDLTRFDSARSDEFEIPSPGLEPEKFLTTDLGFKKQMNNWQFNVSLYYTDIEDLIQRVPTGGQNEDGEFEITKLNLGDGYVYGGDFTVRWQASDSMLVTSSVSYIDGEADTFLDSTQVKTRDYISRLMPLTLNTSVNYQVNDRLESLVTATFSKRANKLSARDARDTQRIPPNGTPGYGVFSWHNHYQVSENLTLSFSIENLFDKNYRIHGSGQNEVGINAILSVDYRI